MTETKCRSCKKTYDLETASPLIVRFVRYKFKDVQNGVKFCKNCMRVIKNNLRNAYQAKQNSLASTNSTETSLEGANNEETGSRREQSNKENTHRTPRSTPAKDLTSTEPDTIDRLVRRIPRLTENQVTMQQIESESLSPLDYSILTESQMNVVAAQVQSKSTSSEESRSTSSSLDLPTSPPNTRAPSKPSPAKAPSKSPHKRPIQTSSRPKTVHVTGETPVTHTRKAKTPPRTVQSRITTPAAIPPQRGPTPVAGPSGVSTKTTDAGKPAQSKPSEKEPEMVARIYETDGETSDDEIIPNSAAAAKELANVGPKVKKRRVVTFPPDEEIPLYNTSHFGG